MTDLWSQMEADVEEHLTSQIEKVDTKALGSVAELARAIRNQEDTIRHLEEKLKTEKKLLLKLSDEDLPAILDELGLQSFKLEDGSEVTVKSTYGATIRVDDREQAYDWLRQNEYDDIIKNTVSVQFGRGEDEKAKEFKELAENNRYAADQKTEIHPQTLRAFIKERVEAGDEFPMQLFGAWVGRRASIKKGGN
jgi:hypothetical protein|tara:strand:+ start:1312 stop:1893 length:582 start_codon:yes stop_codon:yes gene_type:complete